MLAFSWLVLLGSVLFLAVFLVSLVRLLGRPKESTKN